MNIYEPRQYYEASVGAQCELLWYDLNGATAAGPLISATIQDLQLHTDQIQSAADSRTSNLGPYSERDTDSILGSHIELARFQSARAEQLRQMAIYGGDPRSLYDAYQASDQANQTLGRLTHLMDGGLRLTDHQIPRSDWHLHTFFADDASVGKSDYRDMLSLRANTFAAMGRLATAACIQADRGSHAMFSHYNGSGPDYAALASLSHDARDGVTELYDIAEGFYRAGNPNNGLERIDNAMAALLHVRLGYGIAGDEQAYYGNHDEINNRVVRLVRASRWGSVVVRAVCSLAIHERHKLPQAVELIKQRYRDLHLDDRHAAERAVLARPLALLDGDYLTIERDSPHQVAAATRPASEPALAQA